MFGRQSSIIWIPERVSLMVHFDSYRASFEHYSCSLRHTVSDNHNQTMHPTNWTMRCECPDWSMYTDIDEASQWRPFTEELEMHGSISLQCDLNQFISGLAFQLLDGSSWYQWWGRCSNHSSIFTTSEWNCWVKRFTIQDGGGNMSTPHSTVFIRELLVAYDHSNVNNTAREWSYKLCRIRPGKKIP